MGRHRTPSERLRAGLVKVGSAGVGHELRRAGVEVGTGCRFLGRPVVTRHESSRIVLGDRLVATSSSHHTALGVRRPVVIRTLAAGARVQVGRDVGLSGAALCAALCIVIGDGTLLGADVTVVDTDFHPLSSTSRRYARPPVPAPEDAVLIGRNVFLGTGVTVLKGSVIGDHAVVGAGSVVSGRVEPATVVAGNPARVVRVLELDPEPILRAVR